jgi:hypothetical protein
MAFAHALRKAHAGRNDSRAHASAVQRDYLAQVSTSSSQSEWHKTLHRTLDERATLLDLQEMDLVVREMILAEELEHGLRHPDGCEPPVELD